MTKSGKASRSPRNGIYLPWLSLPSERKRPPPPCSVPQTILSCPSLPDSAKLNRDRGLYFESALYSTTPFRAAISRRRTYYCLVRPQILGKPTTGVRLLEGE
ncbi:uncharacterized protein PV06_06677 [Exophiala oligosperma]|uniref:Uncharacterized protein n=1 Tax=Exophiala oligosperma TaxID=215243 RepID=A0A0D2AMC6_9EURO|nr:uncharacterized protein PV06_06677 [Exophiala oligosperma]KIW41086.1 hypothetical protein PV06_06677 [Exophiala oligosperma]